MDEPFTKTGGAQFGWVNASWPLAELSATSTRLTIAAKFLGTYSFAPEQVSAIERYVIVPVFAWGIRVRHQLANYPQRIIFWSLGSPETILAGIRNSGFLPTGPQSRFRTARGIPLRWSAVIGLILVWNILFILPHALPLPAARWFYLLPLLGAVALSLAAFSSPGLQRIILKPGRAVGEIKPLLSLVAFVSGLLAIILFFLLAVGRSPLPS